MTTSINLESLAVDITRRDRWGRYLVVPTTGGSPVGYTRVTTVAKTFDSTGGLAGWKASMAIQGLMMRRGLRAQWETLMAEHGGDAWYGSEASKAACKRLVEECAAVGGANDRREMGSSLHAISALIDSGEAPAHLTEETQRDLEAYRTGLAEAHIEVLPGQVELTVVLDEYGVAGTFDRLATVPGFDLPLIADLKTGSDLSYSWQSFSIQLAAYSRANAIYRQGQAADGSADVRLEMPEVDQEYGLVMWLNAGKAKLELFLVELNPGWEAFERAIWTREWRKQDLAFPFVVHPEVAAEATTSVPATRAPAIVAAAGEAVPGSSDSVVRRAPARAANPNDLTGLLEASVVVEVEAAKKETDPHRAWLQERIEAIGHHAEARVTLGEHWPPGLPTLRASKDHTPEQLNVIEKLCSAVERAYRMAFPPEHPYTLEEAEERVFDLFPVTTDITNHKETR